MAQLLKGLPVANALTETLVERVAALNAKNVTPTLAILRVGERGDDISYETGAMKRCAKVGIDVRQFLLKADCTKEELLEAQKHPEQYRDLIVRVAGYSALFTTLSKSLQDDIINRTEQAGF
mgnify:CR=1 FL=1